MQFILEVFIQPNHFFSYISFEPNNAQKTSFSKDESLNFPLVLMLKLTSIKIIESQED